MAVAYVTGAAPTGNPTTSFTITIPTVSVNDILILDCVNGGARVDPTVSDNEAGSSWTKKYSIDFATASRGFTYWRRATASSSAKVITASGFTDSSAGVLTVYSGCITSADPFDQGVTEANIAGNETMAGFTPSVTGTMACLAVLCNDNVTASTQACTNPGALTERQEKSSTGGADTNASHASLIKNNINATGNFTWAQTDFTTGSICYNLKPEPTTTTITPDIIAFATTKYTPVMGLSLTPSTLAHTTTKYAPVLGWGIIPNVASLTTTKLTPVIGLSLTPSILVNTLTIYIPIIQTGGGDVTVIPDIIALATSLYTPVIGLDVTPNTISLSTNTFIPIMGLSTVPGVASLTATGYIPVLNIGVTPLVASLGTSLFTPVLGLDLTPNVAQLQTNLFVPNIGLSITPSAIALILSQFIPSIGLGVIPSTLSLTLTNYTAGLELQITPDVLALISSLFTPSIEIQGETIIIPGTLAMGTSLFIPVLNMGMVPSLLALTTTKYKPALKLKINPSPLEGKGFLVYAGHPPVVELEIL